MRRIALALLSLAAPIGAWAAVSVEIDLETQRAYLLRNRRVILESPVSSGRAGHHTRTGRFKVTEKDVDHRSSIYGRIVDGRGRTIVADADTDTRVPPGCRFIPAPMEYFIRFDGANGMHAGHLPGYAASHGCVRLPKEKAIAFYRAVEIGTPVTVFGRTPSGGTRERREPRDQWEDDWRRREPVDPWPERPQREWRRGWW